MKSLFIMLVFLCVFHFGWSQSQDDLKKIEAARIGLITERLGLSPDQAEKFWPLYNEFVEKRKEYHKELATARASMDLRNASEEDKRRLIDLGLKIKERELALERDYSDRLLRVISSQQMLVLKKAEDDFREMLLRRIQQQRAQGRNEDQIREKYQERIERKRGN